MARPLVEVLASRNEELQMVQTGVGLAEAFAGVLTMAHQAEHEPALRLSQADVVRASVCGVEVIRRFHRQHLDVPSGAPNRISNGEVDLHAAGDGWHCTSLPGDPRWLRSRCWACARVSSPRPWVPGGAV